MIKQPSGICVAGSFTTASMRYYKSLHYSCEIDARPQSPMPD